MLVQVRLFAIARQRAGRQVVEVDLPETATVADLKAAILSQTPSLASLLPVLRFSVNSEYADDTTPIPHGADLAAIPPVSGGSES
jgi:molybdopterin converting factor small subunit